MKYIGPVAVAVALISAAPGFAKPVVEHKLSVADEAEIDALTGELFTRLKAGDVEGAVQGFLGSTELMDGKKAELTKISSQIRNAIEIYGPISNCLLATKEGRAGIVEEQQFLCQHDKFVVRWKLLLLKTSKQWIAGLLYFDENVMTGS